MINIIGTIWGTSGYANHTRGLANALNELVPVKLSTDLFPGYELQLSDKELAMVKREGNCDTVLMITLPIYWKNYIQKEKKNIGFLVWEGDKIPLSWLRECSNPDIDMIYVPSEHTKQAILNTERDINDGIIRDALKGNAPYVTWTVRPKIVVIPHGVDLTLFKPLTKPNGGLVVATSFSTHCDGETRLREQDKTETFKFLCNKGYRNLEDRGGIQYAVKAFMEEFKDENVELVLKINPAYPVGMLPVHPKIKVITANLSKEEMVKLYQDCDVFVSPTRAEAFNLPCIEAMACGKSVITSNFGGQTDFVNETNGWLVGGELTRNTWEVMYEETRWLTPNIDEIRKAMREAYENRELTAQKGVEAWKKALKYSWDATAQKITESFI
jgi:glycosyltransferase involved in cell wall biosynthesis